MSVSDGTAVRIFFNLGFLYIGILKLHLILRYSVIYVDILFYVDYSFLFQVETTDKLKQIIPWSRNILISLNFVRF